MGLARFRRDEPGLTRLLAWDCALFAALLAGYVVVRSLGAEWPKLFHFPSGLMAVAMGMFLLVGSVLMPVAQTSAAKGDRAMAQRMVALVIVGWLGYLFLLAIEWARMFLSEGVGFWSNAWGRPELGLTYYGITAIHALHVVVGVVWLSVISAKAALASVDRVAYYVHAVNAMFVFLAPVIMFSAMDLKGF